MAHLTATQKKNRNKFIALLVAIVVVAAAIVYVVYSDYMSESDYIKNQDFATALSEVYGKSARSVKADDLAKAKLVSVSSTGEGDEFYVMTGDKDAVAEYENWYKQSNDENAEITADVSKFSKMATFETEKITSDDLKYFTGAEVVELGGVEIKDPEFFANFKNLKYGTFSSCSIIDVSSFASLDLSKIESLNFSGNDISDWSALESIAEKVIVSSSYSIDMDDDGNYTLVPVKVTLAEQMEQEKQDAEDKANAENDGEESEEQTPEVDDGENVENN